MNIDFEKFKEDSLALNSASTAMFYLNLIDKCDSVGQPTMVNISQVSRECGITNPYLHMRRLLDAGYIRRKGKTIDGTEVTLVRDYTLVPA